MVDRADELDQARPNAMPPHVGDTLAAIAQLHADHQRQAGPAQRLVERATALLGRPAFLAALSVLVAAWMGINLALGRRAFDPVPFEDLQGLITLVALYAAVLILITQRRDDQIGRTREQLTLQLAILAEQKSAKIIALLEELRRDHPELRDREDTEASAMAVASDTQAVLQAMRGTMDDSAGTPPA